MNNLRETPDPLPKCLTDDAAHLPGLAARQARQAWARRVRNRRRLAQGLAVAILTYCSWQALHLMGPDRKQNRAPPTIVHQPPGVTISRPGEFVKIQTLQQVMSEPAATPPGASDEQKALLEAARDQPLLLVIDDSGRLARIHVIER